MTEYQNLTTAEEITDLVASFRADNAMPVFSPEEGDETWIYSTDESSRLSPLKAIVPTPVFHEWQARVATA